MSTLLNLTADSVLVHQNQVYIADSFMSQYVNALLLVAIVCVVAGFGTALLFNDVIKPYLMFRLFDWYEDNDYILYRDSHAGKVE